MIENIQNMSGKANCAATAEEFTEWLLSGIGRMLRFGQIHATLLN